MKKKLPKTIERQPREKVKGVTVALPNTIHVKMEAIAALARATEHLSVALGSTNVYVNISNVDIRNVERGIDIQTEQR